MKNGQESEAGEELPEYVTVKFDNKEDAIALVKEFWNVMPDGHYLGGLKGDEWMQELTVGDRTSIEKQGSQWVVLLRGNNVPLSPAAVDWLRKKSLIQ